MIYRSTRNAACCGLGCLGYKSRGRGSFGSAAGRCEGHPLGRSPSTYVFSMKWRPFGKSLASPAFPGLCRTPVPCWGVPSSPFSLPFPACPGRDDTVAPIRDEGRAEVCLPPHHPPHHAARRGSWSWAGSCLSSRLTRELWHAGSPLLSSPQYVWKTTAVF